MTYSVINNRTSILRRGSAHQTVFDCWRNCRMIENRNCLVVAGKKIVFDFDIRTIINIKDCVLVLLSIPFNSNSLDNIYAISLKTGEVIWRVASCDKWKNPLLYENMSQISDDQLVATDFYARKVIIDVKTGEIIKTGISK